MICAYDHGSLISDLYYYINVLFLIQQHDELSNGISSTHQSTFFYLKQVE